MSDIELEVIALPDLQRPFVWEDTRGARSLRLAFPWLPRGNTRTSGTRPMTKTRVLSEQNDRHPCNDTGHRRSATSYVALRRDEGRRSRRQGRRAARKVMIAFRPRDGRFEVADAAIRNDPEFLPNITELWNPTRTKLQIRKDLMNALRDKGRVVDDAYENAVEHNLERAHAIADYRFPTVDIRKTSAARGGNGGERRRDLRPYQQSRNAPRASRLCFDAALGVSR